MKGAFQFVCALLAAAHLLTPVDSACDLVQTYDTVLLYPACTSSDVGLKLPNYSDAQKYFECTSATATTPVSKTCVKDEYFIYVLQACGPCSKFIPAPPCESLKTQSASACAPSDTVATTAASETPTVTGTPTTASTGSGFPTPYYPSTETTTTERTTRSTAAPTDSTPSTTKAPIVTPPTPPIDDGTTEYTGNPTVPIETTRNTAIPMPPTDPPQAPNVTPPTET